MLGGVAVAGGKMKSTGTSRWTSPNTSATNESGFTGLPGGYRNYDGTFYDVGNLGSWWSASQYSSANAWNRNLAYNFGNLSRYDYYKGSGSLVRCLKD